MLQEIVCHTHAIQFVEGDSAQQLQVQLLDAGYLFHCQRKVRAAAI